MILEIKYIIAALYSNYSTAIIDDTGIEQQDAVRKPARDMRNNMFSDITSLC